MPKKKPEVDVKKVKKVSAKAAKSGKTLAALEKDADDLAKIMAVIEKRIAKAKS